MNRLQTIAMWHILRLTPLGIIIGVWFGYITRQGNTKKQIKESIIGNMIVMGGIFLFAGVLFDYWHYPTLEEWDSRAMTKV